MRIVCQRTINANVAVSGEIIGEINKGIAAFVGISNDDNEATADYMLDKLINLRIFEDSSQKMNLSLLDTKGDLLLIPNFTLYGDARKGRRPNFTSAGNPAGAEILFEYLINKSRETIVNTQCGRFGADMKVNVLNDGPVTILLDSNKSF